MRRFTDRRPRLVPARLLCAAVASACLALGSTASAQGVEVTPNNPKPSPGWTLTPTFTFSTSTDSNVTLVSQGNPSTPDNLAAFAPSAEIGYLGPDTTFTAGYAGSANRYFTLTQLDTFDQRLYADWKQRVAAHWQLFAHQSAGWMPTTDTLLLNGLPFLRVGSRLETADGGVTVSLAKFTTLTAAYRFEWVGFDRSNPLAVHLVGGHSNGSYGSVQQQLSPHLFIGGTYDIRRVLIGGGLQQFDIQNGEGTVEYRFSPALSVSGGFGIARISGGSLLTQSSRVGPAYHAGATYKIDRATAYGSYQRSYVPSFGIGGTIQNQEIDAGAMVPIAFRDRLVVGGLVAWRRNEPLALNALQLTSRWVNLYGGYSVAPWLRIQGFFGHSNQGSRLGDVLRNQVGVQVVTFTPVRFK